MKYQVRADIRKAKCSGGYIRIPFELLSLKIPNKSGGERLLTQTEFFILSFILQYSEKEISVQSIANILSLSMKTVSEAIKTLQNAGFIF